MPKLILATLLVLTSAGLRVAMAEGLSITEVSRGVPTKASFLSSVLKQASAAQSPRTYSCVDRFGNTIVTTDPAVCAGLPKADPPPQCAPGRICRAPCTGRLCPVLGPDD